MKSPNQFRGLQQHPVLEFYTSCNKALSLGGFWISVTKLTAFIIAVALLAPTLVHTGFPALLAQRGCSHLCFGPLLGCSGRAVLSSQHRATIQANLTPEVIVSAQV